MALRRSYDEHRAACLAYEGFRDRPEKKALPGGVVVRANDQELCTELIEETQYFRSGIADEEVPDHLISALPARSSDMRLEVFLRVVVVVRAGNGRPDPGAIRPARPEHVSDVDDGRG